MLKLIFDRLFFPPKTEINISPTKLKINEIEYEYKSGDIIKACNDILIVVYDNENDKYLAINFSHPTMKIYFIEDVINPKSYYRLKNSIVSTNNFNLSEFLELLETVDFYYDEFLECMSYYDFQISDESFFNLLFMVAFMEEKLSLPIQGITENGILVCPVLYENILEYNFWNRLF